MNQWIYTLVHLLLESFSAHRDAQIRFLKEENRILRSRISSQRLILDPEERTRLLTIGAELKHQIKGLVGIVQFRTYQRWVKEQDSGIKPGRVGRHRKIGKDVRQAIIRMAKENPGWGYLRIVGERLKLRCALVNRFEGYCVFADALPKRPQVNLFACMVFGSSLITGYRFSTKPDAVLDRISPAREDALVPAWMVRFVACFVVGGCSWVFHLLQISGSEVRHVSMVPVSVSFGASSWSARAQA